VQAADVAHGGDHLLGPGYIQFSGDRTGHFRFIAVEGWMDCHSGQRDGRPCVEFTWEGNDESDPASGHGWAALDEDGLLRGHIYFHLGDDSGFRAVRAEVAEARGEDRRDSHPGGGVSRKARRTVDPRPSVCWRRRPGHRQAVLP